MNTLPYPILTVFLPCGECWVSTGLHPGLDNQADIAKVQEWLSHANIATTRIYDPARAGPRTARRSRSHITLVGANALRLP